MSGNRAGKTLASGYGNLVAAGVPPKVAYAMVYPKPVIVTSYVFPPIPLRTSDWCAYRDGEEEAGGYGWGATEAEAIADLLEQEAERDGD